MSSDSRIFQFKQFIVKQDCSAMKVGTDSVLLGAWTSLENFPNRILDIGAGTGILSLMMAQRSDASVIDAIELNSDAYEECVENFENSLWNDRLFCYNGAFQDLVIELEEDEKYDLIISNPPFFSENTVIKNEARAQARQTATLSFQDLLTGVKSILNVGGIFSVIIPYSCEQEFCLLAEKVGLYPNKITHVKGSSKSLIKRSMLLLKHRKTTPIIDELVLEIERNQYTDDYKKLVQDFYIFERFKL